jgi:hypothetical protein
VSVLGRRPSLLTDSVGTASEVAELLRSKRLAMELRSDLKTIMFCCLLTECWAVYQYKSEYYLRSFARS